MAAAVALLCPIITEKAPLQKEIYLEGV